LDKVLFCLLGFDSWCGEIPQVNQLDVNQNYRAMGNIEQKLEGEFKTEMQWKVRP